MPYCPSCGVRYTEGALFCEACGTALSVKARPAEQPPVHPPAQHPPTLPMQIADEVLTCPRCGAELEPGSLFCDMCGAALYTSAPADEPLLSVARSPTLQSPAVHPPTVPDMPAVTPDPTVHAPVVQASTVQAPSFADPLPLRKPSHGDSAPPGTPAGPGATAVVTPLESPSPIAQARLVVKATQTVLHLPYGKQEVLIGRDDPISNLFPDIDLTDCGGDKAGVSRQHARIFFQANRVFIEDRDSTNHTYVNGAQLTPWQPYPLQDGDEIRFGYLVVNFNL